MDRADGHCRVDSATRDLALAESLEPIQVAQTASVGELHASALQDVVVEPFQSRETRAGIFGHVALARRYESDSGDLRGNHFSFFIIFVMVMMMLMMMILVRMMHHVDVAF